MKLLRAHFSEGFTMTTATSNNRSNYYPIDASNSQSLVIELTKNEISYLLDQIRNEDDHGRPVDRPISRETLILKLSSLFLETTKPSGPNVDQVNLTENEVWFLRDLVLSTWKTQSEQNAGITLLRKLYTAIHDFFVILFMTTDEEYDDSVIANKAKLEALRLHNARATNDNANEDGTAD